MIEIYPSQLGFPILFYLTSLGAMFAIGYLIGETKEVNKRIKQLEMEKKNELNEEPKKAGEKI